MQPIWEITIRNKQLSWTFFSTFTRKLASVALPAQKVPSIVQDTSQARDLHHWQNAYVHMVRNMSLWGVGSSAQSLNSAQDWEGNLLLICSQCRAHRSKYFMQSGNDHTHIPCLLLPGTQKLEIRVTLEGLRSLTVLWRMPWCLLVLASGLRIAGIPVKANDLYITSECLWVFTK